MNKIKTFFSAHWQLLFWPAVASLIFIPTCGTYTVLPSPDSPPFYAQTFAIDRFVNLLAESPALSLDDVLELILPPLFRHDFTYWLSVIATALGGYWLMRERNAPKSASAFAGGAFAFAGYSFTLVSAGHRAYFTMTPYVVATFAFLIHAVRREDLLAYALAAATAAWTFRFGPDVGPQFLVIAAFYAIWLFATNSAIKPLRERTRRFLIGVGCALFSFALVASPSIVHTLTTTLAWRQQQIAQSSGTALTSSGGEAEAKKAGVEAAQKDDEATKKQEQWIFATNWSLPPEETIEFIAPGIFGTWTGDRDHPYWGRLGRSAGWDEAHPDRGGFFNFRQHLVYLGSIPLALAIFAVAAYFTSRRKRALIDGEEEPVYLSDTPFWLAVGIVALLLAFGRYAPFYRLFYSIPYMSYLRAPVKFMRLVELAVAILAGSGLAALMADNCKRSLRRGLGFAAVGAAALCAIYAMHVNASANTFAAILGRLGATTLMRPMALHAVRSLWHAILGFGLVAGLAFALAKGAMRGRTAAAVMLVALAIDIAVATRPFMFTVDKSLSYRPNAITEAIHASTPITEVPIVTILGVQGIPEWFRDSLSLSGIRRQPYDDIVADCNAFLSRSNGDIAAMCRETGSQYLIAPVSLSRTIDRAAFEHVFFFSLGANGVAKAKTPNQNALELLRAKKFLPYCSLHATWRTANEADWMARMAASGSLVIGKDIPCPNENAAQTHGTAKVLARRYQKGHFFTKVETDSPDECILLVLDRTSYNLSLWVDSEPAEAVPAGYAHYMGVHLKPGHHIVKIGKPLTWRVPVFSAIILLLVLGGAVVFVRRVRRSSLD